MTKLIDCFLPQGNAEETRRNVEELKSYDTVATVNVVEGNIKASATLKDIANKATAPSILRASSSNWDIWLSTACWPWLTLPKQA